MEQSYQTAKVTFSTASGKEICSVFERVEVLQKDYQADGVHLKIRGERVVVKKILEMAKNGGS